MPRPEPLTALPAPAVAPTTGTTLLARTDLIAHRGRLCLINAGTTPQEAIEQDLHHVRGLLDAAGVTYLLVRGEDRRPVLAIDRRHRKTVATALTTGMAAEPFYAEVVRVRRSGKSGSEVVLVADGGLRALGKVAVLRLWRPRVEPRGELRYGSEGAICLEFWRYGEELITTPNDNALTRRSILPEEIRPATVQRYGATWPTLADMFAPGSTDIDFEIDLVFSWVDGSSEEWQRARARRMSAYVVGEGDDSEARFRQLDELRYALRGVHLFAPWIRRVHIVTDSPRPVWLSDTDRVRVVRSTEFFADPSVLPTHNSMAVESQLARIPGLAEHFIYSNDDMFLARPVDPELFFSAGGVTGFVRSHLRIGTGESHVERSGFENAARVNRELLRKRFGRVIDRHLEHAPVPLRRSVLLELEREFPEEFAATAASAFRAKDNVSVTNSLYHYFALFTGRAVIRTDVAFDYLDTTSRAGLAGMNELLRRRNGPTAVDMFCLNDGSFPEVDAAERAVAVRSFLDRYFPFPAPWERSDQAERTDQTVGMTTPS